MRKVFISFWAVCLIALAGFSSQANAQHSDYTYTRHGITYRCSGFPTPTCVQCVQGKKCDAFWSSGGCREYARYEVCGYTCAIGKSCNSRWPDNTCRDWDVDAACGSSCTREEVCDSRWPDGTCRDYGIKVTCQQY